jgi:hypothetical protein
MVKKAIDCYQRLLVLITHNPDYALFCLIIHPGIISGSILRQQYLQHLLRLLLYHRVLGLSVRVHGNHAGSLSLDVPHGFRNAEFQL